MNRKSRFRPRVRIFGVFCALLAGGSVALVALTQPVKAAWPRFFRGHHADDCPPMLAHDGEHEERWFGTWFWLRSPEEEKRVITSLYNRYCIRCHGVDGRGVWDIPDVPDFTNARWQACRSDAQLARATLEGRGAVMPAFRGTLTLEEAWAMARYLRTFLPGTESPRPDRAP
jgi:mono/diheme cytochrome c family protein